MSEALGGTLVTGFLGFGSFARNPSAILAQRCGRAFELIEVSFAAADAFVESLEERSFARLLLMGVAASSSVFRLERMAKNQAGRGTDVRGIVWPTSEIDPASPPILPGTLWTPELATRLTIDERIAVSDDAGDYLCNYIYYRALQRVRNRPVGFLHVPPESVIDRLTQGEVLEVVLREIENARRL